jgi:hypothetical protein
MGSDLQPKPGDLLVTRRTDGRGFEISVIPGEAQLLVNTLVDAVGRARQWASRKGQSVWVADGPGPPKPAN